MKTTFFVPGVPRPGGSKNAFLNRKTGKIMVMDAGKGNKPWRETIAATFVAATPQHQPLMGLITLAVRFYMPRPKGHYGTGKNKDILKPNAPEYCGSKPDTTKLLRAVEDSLNKVAWDDDSKVVFQIAVKKYANDFPGCLITIASLDSSHEIVTILREWTEQVMQQKDTDGFVIGKADIALGDGLPAIHGIQMGSE